MAYYALSALTNLGPCAGARVLVAGGTGIIGSGVVQALLKQGATVVVGTRSLDRFNCLREEMPEKFRHNLSVVLGDMGTQCGAKSVFQQVATDFGGIQHVIATMKGHKIWWQCGRMWDQSLHGFHSGASEEVTGHFLLMKSFIPYLENVKGSTYTIVTGYPGSTGAAPATSSSLMCLMAGTLHGLAEAARAEQTKPKVAVSEVHIKCLVHKQLDCNVCCLGSQHLGNDLIGSVVTSVAAYGARREVVINGREDAMDWARAERPRGLTPHPPSSARPSLSPASSCTPSPPPSSEPPLPNPPDKINSKSKKDSQGKPKQ